MSTGEERLTLDLLPDYVLLQVADELEPISPLHSWCMPSYYYVCAPSQDVFQLSSVSRSLRDALAPVVFRSLCLGDILEPEEETVQKLGEMEQRGRFVLSHVRRVTLYNTTVRGVKILARCIEQMQSLVTVVHCMLAPFPPQIISALATLPRLHTVGIEVLGVESLPALLSLAPRLRGLRMNAYNFGVVFPELAEVAPFTVARERRLKLPLDRENCPTSHEQMAAWDDGLARLLLAAKDTISWIQLSPQQVPEEHVDHRDQQWMLRLWNKMKALSRSRSFPVLPALERIMIGPSMDNIAFQHILSTSNRLTHLDLPVRDRIPLGAPPRELSSLRSLHYLFHESVSIASYLPAFIRGSALLSLGLNGVGGVDLENLFTRSCPEFPHLRRLCLVLDVNSKGVLTEGGINAVVKSCPRLQHLSLDSGGWNLEAVWLLDTIGRSLPNLVTLRYDHPHELPRRFLFPSPDGRTIRTNRHGDFRVISTHGNTIAEEMERRIREDLAAVKPSYEKLFTRLARRTHLALLDWGATQEVDWVWRFERIGRRIVVEEEATVNLEGVI